MTALPTVAYVLVCPANVLTGKALAAAQRAVLAALQTVSPAVDADTQTFASARARADKLKPDSKWRFWVDCRGLARTYPDDPQDTNVRPGTAMARALLTALKPLAYHITLVVGFSRFNTCCLASGLAASDKPRVMILPSPQQEATRAAQTPLACLGVVLRPALQQELMRLGIDTVGQLARLPAGGLLERYGQELYRIYQLARQEIYDPLVAAAPVETRIERQEFEDGIVAEDQLLFVGKRLLARLLPRLGGKHLAVAQLHMDLVLDMGAYRRQTLRLVVIPAHATLDELMLTRLLGHKLAATPLPHPVCGMSLWATEVAATTEQLQLFAAKPRRDLAAGNEALAKLRAELGEAAVVQAVAAHGHLPEARFRWEPYRALITPSPRLVPFAVVRRVYDKPWQVAAPTHKPLARPYRINGGWWAKEITREYMFVVAANGHWQWLYYDEARGAWFLQGRVE